MAKRFCFGFTHLNMISIVAACKLCNKCDLLRFCSCTSFRRYIGILAADTPSVTANTVYTFKLCFRTKWPKSTVIVFTMWYCDEVVRLSQCQQDCAATNKRSLKGRQRLGAARLWQLECLLISLARKLLYLNISSIISLYRIRSSVFIYILVSIPMWCLHFCQMKTLMQADRAYSAGNA